MFDAGNGLVSEIIITDRRGNVVAAYPSAVAAAAVRNNPAFKNALSGVTGFHRDDQSGIETGYWFTRTVLTPGGKPLLVLLHLDIGSGENRRSTGSPGGWAFLLGHRLRETDHANREHDPRGPGLRRLGSRPARQTARSPWRRRRADAWQASTLTCTESRESPGESRFLSRRRRSTPRPGWRSRRRFLCCSWAAIVAVVAAWLMSRRLVEPLRALEVAAYRAATGSYVKPIVTQRDDEIGQVADAFNAVALRLNALHDLSQLLASASRLDQVLDGILSAMGHIVGPGVAAIYLLDDTGRWLVPSAVRGADVTTMSRIDALGESWLAKSLQDTDSVAHSGDAERLADELPGLADSNSVALVAPLVSGQEALGVVVVLKDKADPITEAEREMVRTFSAQAAIAVQNSRLFAVETESRRISDGLRIVAEQLARSDGLEVSLSRVEGVVVELLDALSATFALVDREALGLRRLGEQAPENGLLSFATRVLLRSEASGTVIVEPGEDAGGDSIMARTGAERLLVIPVAVESAHGAVLVVSLPAGPIGKREFDIASAVSNEVALALENAYLYERARRPRREPRDHLPYQPGGRLVTAGQRRAEPGSRRGAEDPVGGCGRTHDLRRSHATHHHGDGAWSGVVRYRRPALSRRARTYRGTCSRPGNRRHSAISRSRWGALRETPPLHGLRSMLAVPMLARGRSIGVLVVFSADVGAFSDEDMNVLQTFASQAALAADTARMYSREHEVASILQASILPGELPEFDEIEAASAYEPAGAGRRDRRRLLRPVPLAGRHHLVRDRRRLR